MSALPPAAVGPVEAVLLPLLALAWWIPYRVRVRALAGSSRAVPAWRQACYAGGLVVLAIALSPPVDTLADQLLAAHMVEHLLIGDIAALLIVLGLTGPLLAPVLRNPLMARLRVLTHPVVAVAAWGINFYVWHAPALYQGALRHDPIHALQHATFLGFGICVWMALLGPLPKPAWFSNSVRLAYIIVVRLIGTVLANAMIFSGTVWYPYYRGGDAHWHIGQMADQISAAGVMMVEESVLTICLFAWLFLKVAREGEERQQLLDFAIAQGVELDPQRAARAVAAGRGEELWERLRARGGGTGAAGQPGVLDEPGSAPEALGGAPEALGGAPEALGGAPEIRREPAAPPGPAAPIS